MDGEFEGASYVMRYGWLRVGVGKDEGEGEEKGRGCGEDVGGKW